MKKILFAFTLLLLALSACGEALYAGDDIYYHAVPDCMGHTYAEVADTESLYPCPVCVQDPADYPGLEVFNLAGLTVIRMSDAWMAAQTDTSGIFAMTEEEAYTGAEAEARVAEYLHGDAYADFRRTVREGGTARAVARYMSNYTRNCDWCQTVHLGGAWYSVYGNMEYPSAYDDDLDFRFFFGPMSQTGDTLKEHISEEYDDYFTEGFRDPPPIVPEDAPVWAMDHEGGRLALYATHGFYLMTFRLTGQDALLMPKLTLDGPGWFAPEDIYAVDADGDALYGAALSQGQASALMRGEARLSWKRFGDFQPEWEGTPYGIIRTEQQYGDWLVLDREGRERLRADHTIERNDRLLYATSGMPLSAYEAIHFVDEEGRYQPRFQACALYDPAQDATLLRGDYLFHFADAKHRGFDYNTWMDVAVYTEGEPEPLVTLVNDDGSVSLSDFTGAPNPATRFTVSGDAAVYLGSYDDPLPAVPEDCFAFRMTSGSSQAHDARCVVVAWSLDGGMPPTSEALGLDPAQYARLR